ncbi:polycystin-1-like [Haemaphysalis longicornis]
MDSSICAALGPPVTSQGSWGGTVDQLAPTVRAKLLSPTTLPLAAAVVTLLVSVATPMPQQGDDDASLVVEVDFGGGDDRRRVRQRPARVDPYCWAVGVTHRYREEGLYKPRVAAFFRGHNTSWVAAHRHLIGVYRDLSGQQDSWLLSRLDVPSDVVATGTRVSCGLLEGRSLAPGYSVSYAVTRMVAVDRRRESYPAPGLLMYNSTGGPSHKMAYAFQEPGTYRLEVALRNPLGAVTATRVVRALDEIRGLRINVTVGGAHLRSPYSLVAGTNATLSGVYSAGSDVYCTWRIVPACDSCTVVAEAAEGRRRARFCEVTFLFPLAGTYSVALEAGSPLGRRYAVSLSPPVLVQRRVRGLRVWTSAPHSTVLVGARFQLLASLEEDAAARVVYRLAPERRAGSVPAAPLTLARGTYSAWLLLAKSGLHQVRVRATNSVSSVRTAIFVHALWPVPGGLSLGLIGCRGHRAKVAVLNQRK